jgi:superoxide dismutase, Cu-Zn family
MRVRHLTPLAVALLLTLAACEDPQDRPATADRDDAAADTVVVNRTETDPNGPGRFTSTEEVLEEFPDAAAAAVIEPTRIGKVRGYVTFTETDGGVRVQVDLEGGEPGPRGFHVHEHGSCSEEDGEPAGAAGGHFDPLDRPHGDLGDPVTQRHTGDFGNLQFDQNGRAQTTFTVEGPTLQGQTSIIGRALMVHADEDDGTTQPTGDSGRRVGCGVITAREARR